MRLDIGTFAALESGPRCGGALAVTVGQNVLRTPSDLVLNGARPRSHQHPQAHPVRANSTAPFSKSARSQLWVTVGNATHEGAVTRLSLPSG